MGLKILMVVQSFYSRDPRVRREAEALVRAGHVVDVISLTEPVDTAQLSGVKVFFVPVPRSRKGVLNYLLEYASFFFRAFWLVCLLFMKHRYDLVQVANMPDILVFSALIPRICGRPVILDIHDPMPELFMEKFGLRLEHWLVRGIRFQERISCRFASSVITVNQLCKDVLVSRGVPSDKCTVILNVPDHNVFTQGYRPSLIENGPFRLIYTGTVAKRHGLDVAIRSMATIRTRIPHAKLIVVGDGDYLDELRALSQEEHVSDMVEFLPPVPLREVPTLLFQSHLGISVQQNGIFSDLCLSTKVLEYLRAGLPVVCALTPAMSYYFPSEILTFFEPGSVGGFSKAVFDVYDSYQEGGSERTETVLAHLARLSWQEEQLKYISMITSSSAA